jgi:DNA-binding XRE family transcriptional regulator
MIDFIWASRELLEQTGKTSDSRRIVYFGLFIKRLQPFGVYYPETPMDKSIYSSEYSVFIRLLRSTREELGLTQEEIATRIGETQSFVGKCERGERRLDIVETRTWCAALGISLHDLVESFDKSCALLGSPKRKKAQ